MAHRRLHPNSLENLKKGKATRWKPGECPNPGGKPSGETLAKQLAQELEPLIKSYKYPWLVKEGDEIRRNPEQLYSAFLARYKLAVMDADTPQRDLVQMGRQVGELAKLLRIKEGNVNHKIDYSPETKALLERCASSYAARHCSHCSPPPTITAEFVDVPQPRLPAAGNSQETP